ncbi:hypothetical protein SEA_PLUMBUS_99 [Mycobacterium phage Plumbus]|uniref:Uncharacterized protein n=2 Tax=Cheoctovirus TaxID=1623281 RepID=A0A6G6XRP7_9CAUD|nr:hypothetical protein I5H17_gp110 [Mycobacterium phage BodEinwohner17]YP_010113882.1 hypothetical protein KNV67_gp099 [Mycobacterium phage Plumbus]AXC37268.1 hypothetical protein SEA_BYCHANCE_91 [Mycobacterium phage ByChance]WNT44549.1 hypothetical protein SEA_BLUECRAB_103 [Mycobacterium phage BlueCrab]QIG61502.1 hypothetical protein SEA_BODEINWOHNER17_110 [Mycobacterium phage BodEinwohner17]QPX62796.1 hypothetical protein SEA_PLUMBUS_99 [Mycobacterium phage Plumbus]
MDDAARARLELRRSNAAQPHRNRHREQKTGRITDRTICYCGDADCDTCGTWYE